MKRYYILNFFLFKLLVIYLLFYVGNLVIVNIDIYSDFVIGFYYNIKLFWGFGNNKKNVYVCLWVKYFEVELG